MKILILQHARSEHSGSFRNFLKLDNHTFFSVHLDEGEKLPDLNNFDALWVLGGPMDVWEEDKYPWLLKEKLFIHNAVKNNKMPFLGLCLGHQLLAEALEGKCGKGHTSEIGVQHVDLTVEGVKDPLFKGMPQSLICLQWHGAEVQEIPAGAANLATSKDCKIQAMRWGQKAYSVQFHIEVEIDTVKNWSKIPTYLKALQSSLGENGAKKLQTDCARNIHTFNSLAKQFYENWIYVAKTS